MCIPDVAMMIMIIMIILPPKRCVKFPDYLIITKQKTKKLYITTDLLRSVALIA